MHNTLHKIFSDEVICLKIFFVKSKSKRRAIAGRLLFAVPLILVIAIAVCQIKLLSDEEAVPVGAAAVYNENTVISFVSDVSIPEGKVKIFADGEPVLDFCGKTVSLNLSGAKVIEIYSEMPDSFTVTLSEGEGVEVFGDKRVFECSKGMNFVCRVNYSLPAIGGTEQNIN